MLKHGHYEELCAAASIGQATPEELLELERHASECERCRQRYFDYLDLTAQQFAAAEQKPTLSAQEAQECLNSELFTRRFLDRAEREGIVFSREVDQEIKKPSPISLAFFRRRSWTSLQGAIAAALIMSLTLSVGYFYGKGSLNRTRTALQMQTGNNPGSKSPVPSLDQRVAELTAANLKLQNEIDRLRGELQRASVQLSEKQTDLNSTSQDREKLASDRGALQSQLKSVQQELAKSEALAANAQLEAIKQRDSAGSVEAALLADQVKIRDLTEELSDKSAMLDQERQLLALGHDVSDLMGARNLHIVDVVDTDPRGKTRPAFGRIFFTEGKSLVFYAYDLNEAKIQKADYQYGVWAKKEGGNKQVQRLGIFYSDDKTQRRWVFKCNDPKILGEIDSVFVTLEPAGSDPSHPKGQNLMYAYLRGQPNHP